MFYCGNPNNTECLRKGECNLKPSNLLLQLQTLAQELRQRVQRLAPNGVLIGRNGSEAQSVNGTLRMTHGVQGDTKEVKIDFGEDQPRRVHIRREDDVGNVTAGSVDMTASNASEILKKLQEQLWACVHAVTQLANEKGLPDGVPVESILKNEEVRALFEEEKGKQTVGEKNR